MSEQLELVLRGWKEIDGVLHWVGDFPKDSLVEVYYRRLNKDSIKSKLKVIKR